MSYSNFSKTGSLTYSSKLEINFGLGWENITDNLEDVSIIETPEERICGLITRQIQVRLILRENQIDEKWTYINTPIRYYVSADGFEEMIFTGFVTEGKISENSAVIDVLDFYNQRLHTEFGSYAIDKFRENDGLFLADGINEESGTVANTNYRPKPLINETIQSLACYLVFNKNSTNQNGRYTINEMLKAMGCFGGFDKDGVFRLKKRVWNSPTSQYDLSDLPIHGSFQNLTYNNDINFNSIVLKGIQFQGQSVNIHNNIFLGKRSNEISNIEVAGSNSKSVFLEDSVYDNIYFGYVENPLRTAFLNVQGMSEDNEGSVYLPSLYTSPISYTHIVNFNGSSNDGISANTFNFLTTPTFAIEVWLRPTPRSGGGDMYIVSNRSSTFVGQAVFISQAQRRIFFLNHGGEAISSNPNFFEWGEAFCLLVNVNTTTKTISFYKNGLFINSATYVNNLNSSTGQLIVGTGSIGSGNRYQGHLQELRIYSSLRNDLSAFRWHNRALIEGQTFNSADDNLRGYWRFNETSGTLVTDHTTNNNHITLNFSTKSTSNLFTTLRKWQSPTLAFLGNYSSEGFSQKITFTAVNQGTTPAFLKRVYIMSPAIYQKIEDIEKKASDFNPAIEIEKKTEIRSFYLNDGNYTQTLANNLLSVYNNKKGFANFKIPFQPRLMVGDIILFRDYLSQKKAVILEKNTSLSRSGFFDILTVKILTT